MNEKIDGLPEAPTLPQSTFFMGSILQINRFDYCYMSRACWNLWGNGVTFDECFSARGKTLRSSAGARISPSSNIGSK